MEGGTAHGWNNSTCVSLGAPLPPYIKEQGGRPAGPRGSAKEGGVLLLVGVGLPFPSPTRKREGEGKRGRGRGKEGLRPPPLVQFGLLKGGAPAGLLPSLSPQAH